MKKLSDRSRTSAENSRDESAVKRYLPVLWFAIWYAALVFVLGYELISQESQTPFVGWMGMGPKGSWIFCYLALGALLAIGVLVLFRGLQKKESSCLLILQVCTVVYVLQVLGYLYYRGPHWMVFVPGMLIFAWFVLAYGTPIVGRLRSRTCVQCGEVGRYLLTSEQPEQRGNASRYCRKHFISELRKCLSGYEGRFVIADRQTGNDADSGYYFFYDPPDMALHSYPQSQIQAVQTLMRLLLDSDNSLPESTLALKIPPDAVKDLGSFDDKPLLTRAPDTIEGTPMDLSGLMTFLESALFEFDAPGREFRINEPYAERGIYLWHGYL